MKVTKSKIVLLLAVIAVAGALLLSACGLNKVESISIKSGTLPEFFVVGEQPDFSGLVVLARYSDGSQVEVSSDELEIESFSTDTMGAKTLKISYEGKQVSTTVMVYLGEDAQYEIVGFKLPQSISLGYMQNSAKKAGASSMTEFKIHNQHEDFEGYYVGSANPFKFLPHISVVFEGSITPSTLNKYTSISSVYLQNDSTGQFELLQENEVEDYVIINEELSTYHFTELAEGRKFRLTVRPAFMSEDELNDLEGPVSFEFTVIDAWNATSAADISRFNNNPHPESAAAWQVYKQQNTVGSEKINGLVLHNDIKLTAADMPEVYFNEDGNLYEWVCVYQFWSARDSQEFQFVGNYFTIDASQMPLGEEPIDHPDAHNSLFGVMGDDGYIPNAEHDAPNGLDIGPVTFKNIGFKGNSQRSEDNEELKRGITFFRTSSQKFTLENTIASSALIILVAIGSYADGSDTNLAVIKDSKGYDTYSNMILSFGARLEIYNSELLNAGGPVIIAMQRNDDDGHAEVEVDALSNIGTDVKGGEGWFVLQGADTIAGGINVMFTSLNVFKNKFADDGLTSSRNIFKDNAQSDGAFNLVSAQIPYFSGALSLDGLTDTHYSFIRQQLGESTHTTSAVELAEILSDSKNPILSESWILCGSNGGILVIYDNIPLLYAGKDGSGNPILKNPVEIAADPVLAYALFTTFFDSDYISLYTMGADGKRISILLQQYEV